MKQEVLKLVASQSEQNVVLIYWWSDPGTRAGSRDHTATEPSRPLTISRPPSFRCGFICLLSAPFPKDRNAGFCPSLALWCWRACRCPCAPSVYGCHSWWQSPGYFNCIFFPNLFSHHLIKTQKWDMCINVHILVSFIYLLWSKQDMYISCSKKINREN